jgi:hypothetical protein
MMLQLRPVLKAVALALRHVPLTSGHRLAEALLLLGGLCSLPEQPPLVVAKTQLSQICQVPCTGQRW